MTHPIPSSSSSANKTINHEQLTEIIEAIIAGKYSWACFLLLRCAGYNPLHYIPYRTYNRLVKENHKISILSGRETNNIKSDNQCAEIRSHNTASRQHSSKITDLDYLEVVNEQNSQLRGGNLDQWLEPNLLKIESMLPKVQGMSDCN
jgi:hypothetical protein